MRQALAVLVLAAVCAGCPDHGGSSLAAPSRLSARFQEDGSLLLTWELGDERYDGLLLEGRQEDGPWVLIGEISPDWRGATLTVSSSVPELSILSFHLGGRRGAEVSWSDEVATQRPLLRPEALTLIETTQVQLRWFNTSRLATTVEVARRTWSATSVTDWEVLPAPEGATSLTDERRPVGQGAEYRVRYVHRGSPGLPAYAYATVQPILVPAPALEVVPGVGIRVTPPPLDGVEVQYRVADDRGVTSVVAGPGPLDLPRWPPSPLTRVRFTVPLLGGGEGTPAAIASGVEWLPAYTVPGDRPLLASSVELPRGVFDAPRPRPARGGDGRFLGCGGAHIWVGQPDEPDAFTVDGDAGCLAAPTMDRLGRIHALFWRKPDPAAPGLVLTHVQRDATGWQAWDLSEPFGASQHQIRVAADGTAHVYFIDGQGRGRYLVVTGGAFVEEPVPAATISSLAVAPDGTAYLLTPAGLLIRDPLGAWSDATAPAEAAALYPTFLAKDGGRLVIAWVAAAGTGWEVLWRERDQGVWGDAEVAARSHEVYKPLILAELGDDGDLAVIGGWFDLPAGAGIGHAVVERRGGIWRHVAGVSSRGVKALGLVQDKLWVLGDCGPLLREEFDLAHRHFALYQDP